MSMTNCIAFVFLFYKATWLTSVRGFTLEADYYEEQDPPKKIEIKTDNCKKDTNLPVGLLNVAEIMKKEDKLALKIYTKYSQSATACASLSGFVKLYVNDVTKWTKDDKYNPEWKDAKNVKEANQDLQSVRAGLRNAIESTSESKCIDLFHLVTCDFGGIRQISPFEFVFKQGPWKGWDVLKSLKNSTAATGYLQVKYGNNYEMDAPTPVMMFADGKGRGAFGKGECGYEAGISKKVLPELKAFFNKTFHTVNKARFVTNQQCAGDAKKGKCGETIESPVEEEFCAIMKAACDYAKNRKSTYKLTDVIHPHCPAKFFLQRDQKKKQSQAMEDCKMPYVGGVSGSILEQLAFYVDRGGALDNELLLVLMAVLNLSGHHSLGEAWATTKVFLDKMGVLDEDVVKNVVNMRDTVPVPVDLKKGCTEGLDEEKFLDALEEVVEKAFE